MVRNLYRAGLLRLGLRSSRRFGTQPAEFDIRMEAEGLAEYVDANARALAAAARKLGAELCVARYELLAPCVRRGRVVEGERLSRIPDRDAQSEWSGR